MTTTLEFLLSTDSGILTDNGVIDLMFFSLISNFRNWPKSMLLSSKRRRTKFTESRN
jgi:hypothetical protein